MVVLTILEAHTSDTYELGDLGEVLIKHKDGSVEKQPFYSVIAKFKNPIRIEVSKRITTDNGMKCKSIYRFK